MGRGRDGHEGKFFLWDGYSIMRMSSDLIWIELERENGEGNGSPLQYSCLENPMDGGAWGCSPWGGKESDMTEQLHFDFSLSCIGEGNGNPLQCSCLENPRDGGACSLPSMGSHRVGHDWSKWLSSSSRQNILYSKIIFEFCLNFLKKEQWPLFRGISRGWIH